jgi:hypothetical protein
MNDMAVKLHVLVEVHLHVVAVATQVVAGEVYEHHVLGVFLGSLRRNSALRRSVSALPVRLVVPAMGSIYEWSPSMRLWVSGTAAEYPESSEIEIER